MTKIEYLIWVVKSVQIHHSKETRRILDLWDTLLKASCVNRKEQVIYQIKLPLDKIKENSSWEMVCNDKNKIFNMGCEKLPNISS
jgi:hypothetical protein